MCKNKTYLYVLFGTLLLILLGCAKEEVKTPKKRSGKRIVATTFPIYQLTRNVVKGREGISLDIMLPSQLGCPHDYSLSPQDMRKLAKSDILVANGLGLESFLGAPVEKVNAELVVINSSESVDGLLMYEEESRSEKHEKCDEHEKKSEKCGREKHAKSEKDDHEKHEKCNHGGASAEEKHSKRSACGHGHEKSGANPHLFSSPRMAAKMTIVIADELSKADPKGAQTYKKNAQEYAAKLNLLADEMTVLGKKLKNNRIVPTHGIFDYLARDMGLEVVAEMQEHGQEPSASEMMALVKTIKEKKVGGVFTEPQYPEKTGLVLAKETGVKIAELDPVATGPEDASIDYYETVMRKNMKTLEETLGLK